MDLYHTLSLADQNTTNSDSCSVFEEILVLNDLLFMTDTYMYINIYLIYIH